MSSPLMESSVSRARERKQVQTKKNGSEFVMRPLKYYARLVAEEREFRPLSITVVTNALVEDIRFAFNHGWNITCVFVGGPGEGKSRGAWRLSKIWTGLTKGKFHYCWDIDQIPDVQDGHWLHIDEWLVPEGQGKMLALRRLKHLYDTGRAKMICISVSTPTAPNIPFATFEATSLAQDFKNRKNMFEIRVPIPRYGMVYIGNAVIPLGRDDADWLAYEAESYARKTKIWEMKGKKIVEAKFDARDLALEVIAWAKEQKFMITSKGIATTFVRRLAEERSWDTNYATEPDIVNWVMIQYTPTSSVFIPEASAGWDGLREAFFQWLVQKKALQEKTAHYLADWYVSKGLNQTQIGQIYGVTRDTVQKAVFRYKDVFSGEESDIGRIAETWMASHMDSVAARVGTGHRDSPDILVTVAGREMAINVKWALTEPEYRRSFDSTPEHQWEHSILAVVNSQKNTIRLYPIAGASTYAHHAGGVPCAPESIAESIQME